MSTDISIKPIGQPTASPFLSSSDGARQSVPTQLPPQQAVTPPDPSARARNERGTTAAPVTNKVTIDKDAAAIVFQTVDDRTSEVIGQYPAESILRRRAYVRALDVASTAIKATPTDRRI